MLLVNSGYAENATYGDAKLLAIEACADDAEGYRKELVQMVEQASRIG